MIFSIYIWICYVFIHLKGKGQLRQWFFTRILQTFALSRSNYSAHDGLWEGVLKQLSLACASCAFLVRFTMVSGVDWVDHQRCLSDRGPYKPNVGIVPSTLNLSQPSMHFFLASQTTPVHRRWDNSDSGDAKVGRWNTVKTIHEDLVLA